MDAVMTVSCVKASSFASSSSSAAAVPAPSALRLNRAIQDAEKLTGHNTSRMSEKLMRIGELHTFLSTVGKMMGSQHPIVDSVK